MLPQTSMAMSERGRIRGVRLGISEFPVRDEAEVRRGPPSDRTKQAGSRALACRCLCLRLETLRSKRMRYSRCPLLNHAPRGGRFPFVRIYVKPVPGFQNREGE